MANNLWDYNPSDLFTDIGDAYTGVIDWLGGMFSPEPQAPRELSVRDRINQVDLESPEALAAMQAMRDRDYIETLRRKAGMSGMPMSTLTLPLPETYDLPATTLPEIYPDTTDMPELSSYSLPPVEAYDMPNVSEDSKIALRLARELAVESEGMFEIPTVTATRAGRLPTRDERILATYGQDTDFERDLLQPGFRDVGQSNMGAAPEEYPRTYDMRPEWLRNADRIREQGIEERGQWQGSQEELAMKRLMETAGY